MVGIVTVLRIAQATWRGGGGWSRIPQNQGCQPKERIELCISFWSYMQKEDTVCLFQQWVVITCKIEAEIFSKLYCTHKNLFTTHLRSAKNTWRGFRVKNNASHSVRQGSPWASSRLVHNTRTGLACFTTCWKIASLNGVLLCCLLSLFRLTQSILQVLLFYKTFHWLTWCYTGINHTHYHFLFLWEC